VFPAGPLRERLEDGLARADAIVLLSPSSATPETPDWLSGFAKPILHARLEPAGIAPDGNLVAFAGLARPEKFFDTLAGMGAKVVEAVPFSDHHPYSEDDLRHLEEMAKDHDARLITTEKDAARLSPAWRARVAVLPVAARFADDAALDTLLAPIRSRMNIKHG
jgi:tetraacyldisaccharide 4'-kinase